MPAIYHEGSWLGNATDPEVLVKDTVGWTGKNRAYSQTNNAVIAHIENGITYDVSWTGSATVTLKKNSASGATITSGSTSPLSFTADADYELYFGSSATVTNIMVKDSRIVDPTYEPYHESVEVMYEEEIHGVNLFKANSGSLGQGLAGITITYLGDGKYKLNGTCTSSGGLNLYSKAELSQFGIYKKGKYTISCGNFTVQSGGRVYFALRDKDIDVYYNTWRSGTAGNNRPETEFIVNNDNINHLFDAYIWINKDVTLDNAIVTPMIRKADIEDSTYRPYNPQAIQNQLNAQGVLGAKNLLKITQNTQTINGVTFTVNRDSDGNVINVTANGTATADATFTLLADYVDFEKGDYKVTGCPTGGTATTYEIFTAVRHLDATATEFVQDFGNGASLTVDNNTRNIALSIIVRNNTAVSNIVFKPMITLASDPLSDYEHYVPYAMTNRELTEKAYTKESSATDAVGTITKNKIYKQGACVFFVFESNALTLAVNDVIAKIPEGCRPPTDFSIRITGDKTIRFQSSGNVVTITAFSNENIRLSASWITA